MKKSMEEFIKEQVELEDKLLFEHVKNDPATHDIEVSKETDEKLFARIRAYEEAKNTKKEATLEEKYKRQQEELLRLRRQNRRNVCLTRFALAAASVVLILAVGMTSIGGADKVLKTLVQTLKSGDTNIKTRVDDGSIEKVEIADENIAYEKMKDMWGIDAVRLQYLPDKTYFSTSDLTEHLQMGKLIYKKGNEVKITYQLMIGYKTSSKATEIHDDLVLDYLLTVHNTKLTLKEYDTGNGNRWLVTFSYNDVQYIMMIMDEEQESVEKIVKNLFFS